MDSPKPQTHGYLHLVLTNATGAAQPLPTELGPLPLHPQNDGFYSVLGPPLGHTTPVENQTGESPNGCLECGNIGDKGIKRHDNLVAHIKNKHGALPAGGSQGDWLIPRVVRQHVIVNDAL
ncbi:hypothetical protein HOY80DRAFT_1021617 [Tuber brumale]|nr:hypothetical protein HOY80DRAFT_1021617 [Tuber brumale]